ncbi:MAG TPA: hypothetical protein VMB21_00720 [Candidatus Limnocylindria bacterium]|nr:hypothetical protein [Candidatus Limnocylindria bacterium]
MKKVLIVLGIVVVVAVVAIFVVGSNLGSIVKKAVETAGPKITQTTLTLGSVSLSPSSGSGSIKDFTLGNPEGYKSAYSVKLGEAKLEVDPSSVLSDKVHIRSIVVTDPHIIIEGGLTDNNLKKIQANVESFAGLEKSAPASASGPSKKLQVDDFLLSGAKVEVKIGILGDSIPALSLPDIHLTNLGSGSDGITAGDLTKRVLGEVFGSVFTQVTAQAGKLGKGAVDAAKGLGEGAKGTLEKAGSGIGDLFKKKK